MESVPPVSVDGMLEALGQVDDVDSIEGASVGADAAAGAECFVYDGLFVRWRPGHDAVFAFHVDGADFGAKVPAAPLWVAAIFANDGDAWHGFVCWNGVFKTLDG